jgi:hypothetical protein
MTKVVSHGQPTLGLVLLIVKEVRDIVKQKDGKSEIITELRTNIASKS